jgi:molybdopterin converting factor small subunit
VKIRICFYSYFKDLAGTAQFEQDLPPGTSLGRLLELLHARFPRLADLRRSTLVAVGVEYQNHEYVLQPGDEVSLFPPVQGG